MLFLSRTMIGGTGPLYNNYHQYVRQYEFGRAAKADIIMVSAGSCKACQWRREAGSDCGACSAG